MDDLSLVAWYEQLAEEVADEEMPVDESEDEVPVLEAESEEVEEPTEEEDDGRPVGFSKMLADIAKKKLKKH